MKDNNWQKCLICGDSKEIIKRIPDHSVDFILTDPPYNLGQYSTGNIPLPGRSAMNNDVAPWDLVDFNPEEWADEFVRILKPEGNLFIFTSYNQIGRWHNCLDSKFDTTNFMIWHKTNPAPKIFKAGFLNSCEMIFTCWNKKHTWNFSTQNEMHNFIESPICMRPERLSNPKHPAQKPVSILRKMLQIASNPGDIVFDPFMGVGSVGVAALDMGRRFIGIEIEKDYYQAAKRRVEESVLSKKETLFDPAAAYSMENFSLEDIFRPDNQDKKRFVPMNVQALSPIIKWAGGKEKELKYILPNLPEFRNFYDPFVGGGSVYAAVPARKYFINDLSSELIDLYKFIASGSPEFFEYAYRIDDCLKKAHELFNSNKKVLSERYLALREGSCAAKNIADSFCQENEREILSLSIDESLTSILLPEMRKNLSRKTSRMRALETKKGLLPQEDIFDNLETALMSAVYMNFRNLYNDKAVSENNRELHCALFLYIRNYSYSGMFRYNADNEFNVPYGGIAYNGKYLQKKLEYYRSDPLLAKLADTEIHNEDFELFLDTMRPTADDFVFLDPPYDSEFSTYAQNEFTKVDQKRLADYLLHRCEAKWMMIIKHTEFIYGLYNQPGINIRTFDKEYLVSFMNRNDRKAEHLLITNY